MFEIEPFLHLTSFLNGKCISMIRFEDVEDIEKFGNIKEFQRCFDQWKNQWNKGVECQRDHFEEIVVYFEILSEQYNNFLKLCF